MVGLIVACEAGFWLLLTAGLVARYLLRRPRLGAALLVSVPLVDVVLLVATVIDLRGGSTATPAHGLAGAYIGFSVAFGHRLVTSTDARVAHRYAGGPAPVPPPRRGLERVRHEWRQWGRAVLAWAIACGVLVLATVAVGDASRTQELLSWVEGLTVAVLVWLVVGPGVALTRERQGWW